MAHEMHSGVLGGFLRSRAGLVFLALVALSGLYLLLTHTGHVLGVLPYLMLMACPLLHLFGHHHGRGGHDSDKGNDR